MNRSIPILVATLLLAVMAPRVAFSRQDTSSTQPTKIVLTDGSRLIGTIVSEDSASMTVRTVSNIIITVPLDRIKTRESLAGRVDDGEYLRSDPNASRLLFSPTARPLRSGQGYFSTSELFFPCFAIGIGNVLTLAGGMSIFPGATDQLIYLAPKITPIQSSNLSIAGGALYINTTSGSIDGAGIVYGLGTYGDDRASLTFGLGWGFYGSDIADKPIALVGGEFRASGGFSIISENWIPPNSDITLMMFGFRISGDNLAVDLGFIYPAGTRTTGFPFMPWFGFAYNFGAGV